MYFVIEGCNVDVRNGDKSLQLKILLDVIGRHPVACLELRQLIFLALGVI